MKSCAPMPLKIPMTNSKMPENSRRAEMDIEGAVAGVDGEDVGIGRNATADDARDARRFLRRE